MIGVQTWDKFEIHFFTNEIYLALIPFKLPGIPSPPDGPLCYLDAHTEVIIQVSCKQGPVLHWLGSGTLLLSLCRLHDTDRHAGAESDSLGSKIS